MRYLREYSLAIILATTSAACDHQAVRSQYGRDNPRIPNATELAEPERVLKNLFINETKQKLSELLNSDYKLCNDIRLLSFTVTSVLKVESTSYQLNYILYYTGREKVEIESGSLELIKPDSQKPQVKEMNIKTIRETVRTTVQSFYNHFLFNYNQCIPNQTVGQKRTTYPNHFATTNRPSKIDSRWRYKFASERS